MTRGVLGRGCFGLGRPAEIVRAVGPGARRGYAPGPLLTASALAVGVPEGLGVGPHSPAICRAGVAGGGLPHIRYRQSFETTKARLVVYRQSLLLHKR